MRFQSALIPVAVLTASLVIADDSLDESKSIEKIELLGGKVERDDKLPGRPVVGIVFLGSKKFSGKHLHLLSAFPSLTSLDLTVCQDITDLGLSTIKEFKHLTNLNLCGTKITDSGLKEIGELTTLTNLNLSGTAITDHGLKELGKLKHLTNLNLSLTKITDVGLSELKDFKSLTTLRLSGNKITDQGLKELKVLTSLTWLSLMQTEISEAGLKELIGLDELTTLCLFGTQINYERVVGTYINPSDMTYFDPIDNQIAENVMLKNAAEGKTTSLKTDAGVKELKKALPKLKNFK